MTYITYSRLVKSLKIYLLKQEYEYISPKTEWKLPIFKLIFLPFLRLLKFTRTQTWDWLARKLSTQILCSITLAWQVTVKNTVEASQYSERCPF